MVGALCEGSCLICSGNWLLMSAPAANAIELCSGVTKTEGTGDEEC
jgi:hypothetical protein